MIMLFLAVLFGYASGSIPVAYIIGRKNLGIDIREHGSGNVGATNMWRVGGKRLGVICFALDSAKGYLPALAFLKMSAYSENAAIAAGAAAVVGHMFPIWLKGSGGKGVATAAGAFLAIAPQPFLYAFFAFLVAGPLATRTISAGAVVAAIVLPYMSITYESWTVTMCSAVIGGLIIYRHWQNLIRLYNGTESRLWSGLDL